ncbi:kinase-like protein [Rozella allomycis CSF55]|uniref:Kinase-like protein n=1 Tax=Rozella allomycis (strain CSF55) TaxID=988480 RepID=A0A075B1I3_ROZAC|nr:Protein kinase, ATP binding site domain-containing protein [Rozella allomycis CSF55]RKP18069.1 kinase-like protein [Rozella allomycis CSF55]|eukprot:EPZ34831.1 Protein kinase, ATP binding site domain-containing protein [Rozella allomycis CSF55]
MTAASSVAFPITTVLVGSATGATVLAAMLGILVYFRRRKQGLKRNNKTKKQLALSGVNLLQNKSRENISQKLKIDPIIVKDSIKFKNENKLYFDPDKTYNIVNMNDVSQFIAKVIRKDSDATMSKTIDVSNTTILDNISVPGYMILDFKNDLILDLKSNLGSGATAQAVVSGKLLNDLFIFRSETRDVAIKYYNDSEDLADLYFEIAIMKNIAKFVGYSIEPRAVVMKKYEASLHDVIHNWKSPISIEQLMLSAKDIIFGLNEMHSTGLVHFDVKPKNVLIQFDKKPFFTCYLCDFGFSNVLGSKSSRKKLVAGLKGQVKIGMTSAYAAPEMIHRMYSDDPIPEVSDKDFAIDIYAYCISVYELLTRKDPWPNKTEKQIIEDVYIKKLTPQFLNISKFDGNFRGWNFNPNFRPSTSDFIRYFESNENK